MTEQEKKILEMLDQATQEVEVPEGLQPEKIEERLKNAEKGEESGGTSGKGRPAGRRWKRGYTYGLAAAACAVVIVGGVLASGAFSGKGTDGFSQETAASQPAGDAGGESTAEEQAGTVGQIASAESYEQVWECFDNYWESVKQQTKNGATYGMFADKGGGTEASIAVEDATAGSAVQVIREDGAAGGYSETNVRTEGVDEADIVKTDGSYLYVLKESAMEIAVVDAREDRMEVAATIVSPDKGQISEFYVKDQKLLVLSTISRSHLDEDGIEFYDGEDAQVETYDLSDITAPRLEGRVTQSGRYSGSRLVGDYLYLFSDYYVSEPDTDPDPRMYIPEVNGTLIPESNIYLPLGQQATQYKVITSIHITEPDQAADRKAVLSKYGECYVSAENIYIYETSASDIMLLRDTREAMRESGKTVLRKISYRDGKLEGVAQGEVKGYLNDSFSIDEYEGKLRLVTTISLSTGIENTTKNAVYVLDEKLETIGQITDIAEDERVYSVRMFGDTGYFVTYRETDPLFSVDFSDPENPKIIGSLKIPGFSEYLHFYGDGLLLGVGMDTEEETGVTNGVKLSMFDISDPADVKEVQKYTIPDTYSSDAFSDYHAVLIDTEKNLIGFSAYGDRENYYIFSYDAKNGFQKEMEEEVNGYSYLGTRGVYIGDRFFVAKGNAIESYRMGSFEKLDDLLL